VALLQVQPQRGAQVLHLFLVHRQVGMARDAELGKLGDGAPGEQVVEMGADDARDGHEIGLLAAARARYADVTRQGARNLDDGDLVLAPKGVAAGQPHNEVERLVGHLREGMRRVQPDRQQQRLHLLQEILLDPALLVGVALAVGHDLDALLVEQRHQVVVVYGVLLGHQVLDLVGNLPVGLRADDPTLLIGLERGQVRREPHLEKLVQVGRDDGQVAQALQQGTSGLRAQSSTRSLKARMLWSLSRNTCLER